MDRTSVQADQGAGYEVFFWGGTDKVELVDQDRKEIILPLHSGLPFMERDDFSNDVRQKLAK
eukprot:12925310-Prorocentrum_lima.AAC.1